MKLLNTDTIFLEKLFEERNQQELFDFRCEKGKLCVNMIT